jgi:large subunit ribosomal protein L17
MARLGQDKFVVYTLFEEIAPRYAAREGGHTRIPEAGAAQVGLHRDGFLEPV